MSLTNALGHVIELVLPAWVIAALLAGLAPLLFGRHRSQNTPSRTARFLRHTLCNGVVGSAVLALGLWFYGVDGKLLTYTALVGMCALSQGLLSRAWRE